MASARARDYDLFLKTLENELFTYDTRETCGKHSRIRVIIMHLRELFLELSSIVSSYDEKKDELVRFSPILLDAFREHRRMSEEEKAEHEPELNALFERSKYLADTCDRIRDEMIGYMKSAKESYDELVSLMGYQGLEIDSMIVVERFFDQIDYLKTSFNLFEYYVNIERLKNVHSE
jgi:hypothetical protein